MVGKNGRTTKKYGEAELPKSEPMESFYPFSFINAYALGFANFTLSTPSSILADTSVFVYKISTLVFSLGTKKTDTCLCILSG